MRPRCFNSADSTLQVSQMFLLALIYRYEVKKRYIMEGKLNTTIEGKVCAFLLNPKVYISFLLTPKEYIRCFF